MDDTQQALVTCTDKIQCFQVQHKYSYHVHSLRDNASWDPNKNQGQNNIQFCTIDIPAHILLEFQLFEDHP